MNIWESLGRSCNNLAGKGPDRGSSFPVFWRIHLSSTVTIHKDVKKITLFPFQVLDSATAAGGIFSCVLGLRIQCPAGGVPFNIYSGFQGDRRAKRAGEFWFMFHTGII